LKEMINRGGEKISPLEIEAALLEHPAVLDAAAFAAPHPTLGEEVAAAVVPRKDARLEAADVVRFMRAQLSDFKVPRVVRVVDELPRNHLGKVQRAGLYEALGLSEGAGSPRRDPILAPRDEIEGALAQLWRDVLGKESVGVRDSFFDLGGTSLEAVSMFYVIEEAIGTRTSVETLLACETIEQVANLLREAGIDDATLGRIRAGGAGS
jgi:acyl carrier protein